MATSNRTILKAGQRLTLCRQGGGEEVWTVTGALGEGGSCVCYSAKNGMKTGRLKEFYPLSGSDAPLCRRERDGSLRFVCPKSQADAAREAFIRAYRLLEQVKEADPTARALNNYIPPYELLYSRDGQTVYVWTPDDKEGIQFESYLTRIWEDPCTGPERKLYHVLTILIILTDCTALLHRVGLCHQDIRPSNFLVLFSGRSEPSGISLFDINTLRSAGGDGQPAGTDGYCAPEVCSGRGDNRSDIFSIGATLLRALINRTFRRGDYDMLDTLLSDAALIRASESNSNVFLRHQLGTILRRTLSSRPEGRYSCCEELMADLRRARAFLIPEVENEHLGAGKRLALLDAEDSAAQSSTAVLHDLLYRYPLDAPGTKDIRVLVVGAGTYGQKFIDICLQAGQMLDRTLSIRAVSQDPRLDREVYLQIRPDLPRFVDLDGTGRGACYARLDFDPEPVRFCRGDQAGNRRAVARLLRTAALPGCVFVSLGDDALNARVAAQFARMLPGARVHFVVQSRSKVPCGGANPVVVNRPLTARAIHPELENMAFNAHLCWLNDPNADPALAKKQFRRKYNLEASLAYALSVGSKLRSVGIREEDPRQAAARFRTLLLQEDESIIEQLTALEHRRWVMEKITSGWRCGADTELQSGILRGQMKDSVNRIHPCIVPCGSHSGLKHYTRQQWDVPNERDETLDELDRISLEQHRLCLAQATRLRNRQPLRTGDLAQLSRELAGEAESIRRTFGAYRRCLEQILLGSRTDALDLPGREAALKQALTALDAPRKERLNQYLDRLRRDFFPAVERCLYRNYRRNDEALIRQIPYVLTNRPRGTLLTVLKKDPIAAAAAALVLRPGKVIWLCHDLEAAPMAERILKVFALRSLRCRTELWLIGETQLPEPLLKLQSRHPKFTCRLIPEPGAEGLKNALRGRKIDLLDITHFDDIPQDVILEYPAFRLDPERGAFWDCKGCEELSYLPGGACLRPEELDALWGTDYNAVPMPEYGSGEQQLWTRYRKDAHWLSLCRKAAASARQRDLLGTLTEPEETLREISMLFPAHRYEQLSFLLQLLRRCGAAEPESGIEADTSDACRLRLFTRRGGIGTMLQNLQRVDNYHTLALHDGRYLRWEDLQIGPIALCDEEFAILNALEAAGLVQDLTRDREQVSFRCAASRIKALLTQPHRLARLEQWHRARQEESRDTVLWLERELLLIRGFRVQRIPWEEE